MEVAMQVIAKIRSDFETKFGIPRQSGIVEELEAEVVLEEGFRDINAIRGLEDFSHIWLLWQFSASAGKWSPTVKPPRLGGNTRKGVFATRSPFRPSPIGLSCVRLKEIRIDRELGPVLCVAGADLMDGTPILDIKPYVRYADCRPEASEGFTVQNRNHRLKVQFPEEMLKKIPEDRRAALMGVLSQDPRPSYQDDPGRSYGMRFAGRDVRFLVRGGVLEVVDVAEE